MLTFAREADLQQLLTKATDKIYQQFQQDPSNEGKKFWLPKNEDRTAISMAVHDWKRFLKKYPDPFIQLWVEFEDNAR